MTEVADAGAVAGTRLRHEPRISDDDAAWIAALPKVELHLHLSGSLRPATALRLARERGRFDELGDATFLACLRAPDICADQAELLEAFEIPTDLLTDAEALSVVAEELVEDVAAEGTRHAEIRFAPAAATAQGLSLDAAVEAVAAGVATARRRLADPPSIGIILIAMRTHAPDVSRSVARAAIDGRAAGVVGFDLAGLEATAPSIEPHLPAFDLAQRAGLGISVHAGEWGGAKQVRDALQAQPRRIAHGGPAVDDEALMQELRARGVTLDLCPTSNVQAGLVGSMAEHPLPSLYRAGVPVTISTDDRTVSETSLNRELALAIEPLGLTRDDLATLTRLAIEAAFLQDDEATRTALAAELATYTE